MKKKSMYLKMVFVMAILSCFAIPVLGKETTQNQQKTGVSIIKPWIVNFNTSLDKSTVNSKNITVKDAQGKNVQAMVTNGEDGKSIIVCPPTGGYMLNKNYTLTINDNLKSSSGKKLKNPTNMEFATSKNFEDCSKDKFMPIIKDIKFKNKPILKNSKVQLDVSCNYSEQVQYRIFDFKYPDEIYDNVNKYPNGSYAELTTGYTSSKDGKVPYSLELNKGLDMGKHNMVVYVKRANKEGKYKDSNTDYDNFYSVYFKVLDSNIIKDKNKNETVVYKDYDKTLQQAVADQVKGSPVYSDNGWCIANDSLIKYYMDGNNFLDDDGKYIFLNLNYMDVNSKDLDEVLKEKGVLNGKGSIFLKAGKESNVNPIYLVAHSLLETGNGTSQLAKGILVSSVKGKPVAPKIVYNVFGVQAFDSEPIKAGSEYAYTQGWFTVDDAIKGGAKFIGNGYINSEKYSQNNLYKMKWNIAVNWHQYATDIGWQRKQVSSIKALIEKCKSAKPVYEIPKFKE